MVRCMSCLSTNDNSKQIMSVTSLGKIGARTLLKEVSLIEYMCIVPPFDVKFLYRDMHQKKIKTVLFG